MTHLKCALCEESFNSANIGVPCWLCLEKAHAENDALTKERGDLALDLIAANERNAELIAEVATLRAQLDELRAREKCTAKVRAGA